MYVIILGNMYAMCLYICAHILILCFSHIYADFLLLLKNEDLIAAFLVVVQYFRYEAIKLGICAKSTNV